MSSVVCVLSTHRCCFFINVETQYDKIKMLYQMSLSVCQHGKEKQLRMLFFHTTSLSFYHMKSVCGLLCGDLLWKYSNMEITVWTAHVVLAIFCRHWSTRRPQSPAEEVWTIQEMFESWSHDVSICQGARLCSTVRSGSERTGLTTLHSYSLVQFRLSNLLRVWERLRFGTNETNMASFLQIQNPVSPSVTSSVHSCISYFILWHFCDYNMFNLKMRISPGLKSQHIQWQRF